MLKLINMIFAVFCSVFASIAMENSRSNPLEIERLQQQHIRDQIVNNGMLKAIIAQEMFKNIKDVLDTRVVGMTQYPYIWDTGVYSRFVCTLRWLGGTNTFLESDMSGFMTADAKYYGASWERDPESVIAAVSELHVSAKVPCADKTSVFAQLSFTDAVFADAIGDIALSNIRALGNDSFPNGYAAMREFFSKNCPNIFYVFGHIAEKGISSGDMGFGPGIDANGIAFGGNVVGNRIHYKAAEMLESFFDDGYIKDISNLGIAKLPQGMSPDDFENELMNEVRQVYNFDYSEFLGNFEK